MAPSRSAFRLLRNTPFRSTFFRQTAQRRAQSTATASPDAATGGWFGRFWNSEVGPKTVHFWAPIMKWGIVLTGVSDFTRPAESLSLTQNLALMATGAIWTRWCFVIRPKNYFLAAVNFFVFCTGSVQVTRVMQYQASQKKESMGQEAKDAVQDTAGALTRMVEDPKNAVKKAERT